MNSPTAVLAAGLSIIAAASMASAQSNVAQGKPVTASAALWPGFPASNLTDGNPTTFAHPQAASGTLGFKFEIDLLNNFNLTSLRLTNRHDCCPERLSNYRVSLHGVDEGTGQAGPALWTANVRTNNTHSGMGGVDVLTAAADPAGTFSGRLIRIENISNQAYNPQVAEVQARTDDIPVPNVALYKLVTSSGTTGAGLPAANLTDGNPGTFSHPQASTGTTGFYYQVDLAGTFFLDRIVLFGRGDGCCPERLRRYRVQLLADSSGAPGAVNWTGDFRMDGSIPSNGGTDVIRVDGGTGNFTGRFIRVSNLSGEAYNPQIAEIEAYRAPAPTIRFFGPDAGNISHGATPGLPAQATLSWIVDGAASLAIDNGVGGVNGPTGSVVVSPAATTTFKLTATNAVGSSTATLVLGVDAPSQPPRISEFLADNGGSTEDEDGDSPDWIEIHNPNTFTLNLGGWHLTDRSDRKTKWAFPAVAIPPGGHRLVFASEKDRAVSGGELHTNFQLAKTGEFLALVAPDGVSVVSEFAPAFPEQKADVSYGFTASAQARFFKPPTPAAANAPVGYNGFVADTSFAVKRGIYDTPQSVAITCATPGAMIRYTTNGAKPSATTGTVYTAPINVATTTTLRAAAFLDGFVPANVDTHTYIFPASVVASSVMSTTITQHPTYGPQMIDSLKDVPSVSVVLPSTAAINDNSETECSFEFIHPDNSPGGHANAGVNYYGGAFTSFAKKNFRFHFRGIFGDRKFVHPVFAGYDRGWAAADEFDGLELRSGSHDMVDRGFYMANIFCDYALFEMGQLQPHGRFVHLYLNGTYWGLFHLRERWDASMHAGYLGGNEEDYEAINGNYNVGGWPDPGSPYDGDGHAWERAKSLRSNYAGLQPFVDVDNYLDYMIAWMFGNAEDEYRCVGPVRDDGGAGFKFFINDADGWLSVGGNNQVAVWDGNNNNTGRAGTIPGRSPGDGPGSLLSAMLQTGGPEFKIRLADRIHRHLFHTGALTPARNAARLTEICTPIQRAFFSESARWAYRSPSSWATARDVCLNQWIPSRTNAVLSQFRNAGLYPTLAAPVFSQPGGSVPDNYQLTMTGPAGATIYFTLDGSDPRLPGDGVAPAALTYSTAVTLAGNTVVKARARSATAWSALNSAFFQVAPDAAAPPGALVVSELFFNPDGDDDAEFIELMNVSGGAINLRGCRFTGGIDYAFSTWFDTILAPGQRLVLVDSDFAFRDRFGWDRIPAGIYRDNVNNDGEAIGMTAADGTTSLVNFAFSDAWWPAADGDGHSLTLIAPHDGIDLNDPSNWRPSRAVGGSSGTSDAVTFSGGDPNADDNGDGFSNFADYALSGPQPVIAPVSERQPDGSMTMTFQRHVGADDALIAIETSADLATWSPAENAALVSQSISNAVSTETWHLPAPPGSSRFFARLNISAR